MPDYILESDPVFGRPSLLFSNILAGSPSGAARSIVDPESLSPDERQTIASRAGLSGPLAGLVNVSTNPLVLAGLAMMLLTRKVSPEVLESVGSAYQKVKPSFLGFTQSLTERLKGTPIPRLLSRITQEADEFIGGYVGQLGDAFRDFEKQTGRIVSNKERQLLVEHLDDTLNPNSARWSKFLERVPKEAQNSFRSEIAAAYAAHQADWKAAPEALKSLAETARRVLNDIRDTHLKDPEVAKALLTRWARREGFDGRIPKDFQVKFLENYWPRQRKFTPELQAWLARQDALQEFAPGIERPVPKYITDRGVESRVTSGSLLNRLDTLLPDVDYLQERGFSHGFQAAAKTLSPTDSRGVALTQDMDFYGISRYIRTLGIAKAFGVAPVDPETGLRGAQSLGASVSSWLSQIEKDSLAGRNAAAAVREVTIPQMMGGLSHKQVESAFRWAERKEVLLDWLHSPTVQKALSTVNPSGNVTKTLTKYLTSDPSSSWPGLGHAIANNFYLATLGAPNLTSAIKNALQPFVNVAPLGTETLGEGYKIASKEVYEYFKLRTKGIPAHKALAEASPLFAKMHLQIDPQDREALVQALESGWDQVVAGGGVAKVGRQISRGLLAPFGASEMLNRMASFHKFRLDGEKILPGRQWFSPELNKWITLPKSGPTLDTAIQQFASELTYATNFGGGPLQTPLATQELWAPLRQLSSFPLRQSGLIAQMARNPNYLGRALFGTGLISAATQQAGFGDITPALLTGGLPTLTDYGPFAPFPLVPPLLQVLGGAGLSLASGDSAYARRTLPLLVPGGVGLSKLLTATPGAGAAAQFIGKPYADYSNQTPDGRIPVYAASGSLQGYYTPVQLWARATGLWNGAGSLPPEKEQAILKWLQAQQTSISGIRQQAAEALAANDVASLKSLDQEYRTRYPGTNGLPLKPADLANLHARRNVTRLERTIDALPPELRPQFTEVVAAAYGANYPAALGLQGPGLAGGSTWRQREPYRLNQLYQGSPTPPGSTDLSGNDRGSILQRARQRSDSVSSDPLQSLPFGG